MMESFSPVDLTTALSTEPLPIASGSSKRTLLIILLFAIAFVCIYLLIIKLKDNPEMSKKRNYSIS